MEVFLKAQIISYRGSICLLACPNPSFHNLSLFLTLHRLQHQSHSIYSTFSYTISSIITTAPPNSFSLQPSPTSAAAAAPFSHATLPAPSTFPSRMTYPAVNSHHLSDHALSQDMRSV